MSERVYLKFDHMADILAPFGSGPMEMIPESYINQAVYDLPASLLKKIEQEAHASRFLFPNGQYDRAHVKDESKVTSFIDGSSLAVLAVKQLIEPDADGFTFEEVAGIYVQTSPQTQEDRIDPALGAEVGLVRFTKDFYVDFGDTAARLALALESTYFPKNDCFYTEARRAAQVGFMATSYGLNAVISELVIAHERFSTDDMYGFFFPPETGEPQ